MFAELLLNELATNPYAPLNNLPYPNPDHLRDCLIRLNESKGRSTKTVLRMLRVKSPTGPLRMASSLGEQDKMLYYPFPDAETLESQYYTWWRSALVPHYYA